MTTSKHRSQAHPHTDTDTFKLSTDAMKFLDDHGYTRFVYKYVLTGEMA
jgi:hypothetical protein